MVWDWTAGHFDWHYPSLFSLEKRLLPLKQALKNGASGAATLSFFRLERSPIGVFLAMSEKWLSSATHMPRPLGFGVLAWNLFLRIIGRL